MNLINSLLTASALVFLFSPQTQAQGSTSNTSQAVLTAPSKERFVETFEGNDESLFLGGQVHFNEVNPPWSTYFDEGKYVLENRQEPNALRYIDLPWVTYPESGTVQSSDGSTISALVEASESSEGGIGILLGSGKARSYLVFAVDGKGRFHMLLKDGRQLRRMQTLRHEAVLIGQQNEITFAPRGANIVFFVNGQEVIEIESPNRMPGSRRIDGRTGVGVAVFGLGEYKFDTITIAKTN
ncbi:MAG: hypothetical protein AAF826_05805 [Pseudomonadota bacterium]